MGVKALQLPISYTSMKLLWRGLGKTGPPQKRYTRGTRGVVRMKGLEPSRELPHSDLNAARLPIPPHPQTRLGWQGF